MDDVKMKVVGNLSYEWSKELTELEIDEPVMVIPTKVKYREDGKRWQWPVGIRDEELDINVIDLPPVFAETEAEAEVIANYLYQRKDGRYSLLIGTAVEM